MKSEKTFNFIHFKLKLSCLMGLHNVNGVYPAQNTCYLELHSSVGCVLMEQ